MLQYCFTPQGGRVSLSLRFICSVQVHMDCLIRRRLFPTDSSFDSLFRRFTSFMFGSETRDEDPPADVHSSSGYQVRPGAVNPLNLFSA